MEGDHAKGKKDIYTQALRTLYGQCSSCDLVTSHEHTCKRHLQWNIDFHGRTFPWKKARGITQPSTQSPGGGGPPRASAREDSLVNDSESAQQHRKKSKKELLKASTEAGWVGR